MAPSKKKVTVELDTPQEKKHVTRFDATDDDAALTSIYVRKDALKTLGNPKAITVTIEAA